jgi:hypothetical protein
MSSLVGVIALKQSFCFCTRVRHHVSVGVPRLCRWRWRLKQVRRLKLRSFGATVLMTGRRPSLCLHFLFFHRVIFIGGIFVGVFVGFSSKPPCLVIEEGLHMFSFSFVTYSCTAAGDKQEPCKLYSVVCTTCVFSKPRR